MTTRLDVIVRAGGRDGALLDSPFEGKPESTFDVWFSSPCCPSVTLFNSSIKFVYPLTRKW
jgi:hypothetical protein